MKTAIWTGLMLGMLLAAGCRQETPRSAETKSHVLLEEALEEAQTQQETSLLAETNAIIPLRQAAEQGLAEAQNWLGVCYANGQGVTKDEVEAVRWFREAAEQNLDEAQNNLGLCYAKGQGVPEDEVEAVKWFRKAAEQNLADGQHHLGDHYYFGLGVTKDYAEAVKWFRKAAEQGHDEAQFYLAVCYDNGTGVAKDEAEAVRWYRKAAEQGHAVAQNNLGVMYLNGLGVTKDEAEAVRWYRKAAEQNLSLAQHSLGCCYANGQGVPKDEAEAYKWFLLAGAQGHEHARQTIPLLELRLSAAQRAEGQRLARDFKPRIAPPTDSFSPRELLVDSRPTATGTGFFITNDGYLVTSEHVVKGAAKVQVRTSQGLRMARVLKVDAANDLALLKTDGSSTPLSVVASRGVRLGNTVATVGFPNIGLQGFAPKLAKGEIASLSGAQDDARFFQISVPVQPGNSGGALFDDKGNVVGLIAAKLDALAALNTTGTLPENVNYAIKSSYLLSFLESVPEVAAKLNPPNTKDMKFEAVVQMAEQATALVLVY